MTVKVTLRGGGHDNYMRFGDAYVRRSNGVLEVHRGGARDHISYRCEEWTDVAGDEKRGRRRFRR